MKKIMAVVLLLVLAASFVLGALVTQTEAARCTTRCDCNCQLVQCCNNVCVVVGVCQPPCPACPPA